MNKKPIEASLGQINASRLKFENPYAHLDGDQEGDYSALAPTSVPENISNRIDISTLRTSGSTSQRRSPEDIERIASSLQGELWNNRHSLFDVNESFDPFQIFDPIIALKALGYNVITDSGLGQYDNGHGQAEVAGYIDSSKNVVGISNQFPAAVRNFTASHELGHAVLHDAVGMHRDRALDGGNASSAKVAVELEANQFASYFLMPEKIVKQEFRARFLTEQFTIDDNNAFLLANCTMDKLKKKLKSSRQLARMLAESARYNTTHQSMKSRFKVSTEAMAIRLEELKLVRM